MPELPEVETIVADLRPHLVGRRIVRCELRFPTIVRHPEPETFVDSIAGLRIEELRRRGKYILAGLEGGPLLVIHLGMSGQLRLVDPATPIEGHTHVIFDLDDGRQLRYRDPRRFGRLLLGTEAALIASGTMPRLGPEPIDANFGADDLYVRLRRRRAPLKAVLLDQSTIAGVGNIYADESLYRARLRPDRMAGGLSLARSVATSTRDRDRQPRQLSRLVPGRMGRDRQPAGPAAGLRPRRRTVLHLRPAARAGAHRRPQHSLLPPLPAIEAWAEAPGPCL